MTEKSVQEKLPQTSELLDLSKLFDKYLDKYGDFDNLVINLVIDINQELKNRNAPHSCSGLSISEFPL